MFSKYIAKKRSYLKKAENKDMIEYYFDEVQFLATFVSIVVIAFSLLIIDYNSEDCDSSYVSLVYVVLITFLLPALFPWVNSKKIKWLTYTLVGLVAAAMIYVPIQYFLTDGCRGE